MSMPASLVFPGRHQQRLPLPSHPGISSALASTTPLAQAITSATQAVAPPSIPQAITSIPQAAATLALASPAAPAGQGAGGQVVSGAAGVEHAFVRACVRAGALPLVVGPCAICSCPADRVRAPPWQVARRLYHSLVLRVLRLPRLLLAWCPHLDW